jgi:hypothetical protein
VVYTNGKKEELSKLLVEHLKRSGEIMTYPENLKKTHLEDLKKMKHNNKVPRLALREQSNNGICFNFKLFNKLGTYLNYALGGIRPSCTSLLKLILFSIFI